MKNKIDLIFKKLLKLFPNPDTELEYSTPFQLLIAVMLSAQTTDKQVNKITKHLFPNVKWPKDILKLKISDLEKLISWINYYKTKAKHIFETAKLINEQSILQKWINKKKLTKSEQECYNKFWYFLPESIEWLKVFPWVWEKTAKVILYVRYHHPIIAVDTHVHRVANRLWLVHTKEPIETSIQIEKVIPHKRKDIAHHSLILFWRYYCTAKKPKCENCILQEYCPTFQQLFK